MKPGGIGRFKPPTPVYRPCALCGCKHRMRPDGSSKTAEIRKKGEELMTRDGQYITLLVDSLICLYCVPKAAR